jgi:hypothetical protein
MKMTKLTVRNLESLTQADVGKRLSDEHALYGRVKAKGDGVCVMFRWRYRFDEQVMRLHLWYLADQVARGNP